MKLYISEYYSFFKNKSNKYSTDAMALENSFKNTYTIYISLYREYFQSCELQSPLSLRSDSLILVWRDTMKPHIPHIHHIPSVILCCEEKKIIFSDHKKNPLLTEGRISLNFIKAL